jgi:hypothetical protein
MPKRKQTKNKDIKELQAENDTSVKISEPLPLVEATNLEIPDAPNYKGIYIANETRPNEKGTMGGVLVSDKGVLYGITCFHTVKENNKNYNVLLPEESTKVVSEGVALGKFSKETVAFNSKIDVALVLLQDTKGVKELVKKVYRPKQYAIVTSKDIGTPVFFWSVKKGIEKSGIIAKTNQEWEQSEKGIENTFKNLIYISDGEDNRISEKGDSGAFVIRTSDKAVIGIVIGDTAFETAVIPITELLEQFNAISFTLKKIA